MPRTGDRETSRLSIDRLAAGAGVLTSYVDGLGNEVRPPAETIRALSRAVHPGSHPAPPKPIIVTAGRRELRFATHPGEPKASRLRLVLEDGVETTIRRIHLRSTDGETRVFLSDPLPVGVHRLLVERGQMSTCTFVLARPSSLKSVIDQAGRRLAVFLPLYAVRPGGSFGVGSYTDLRKLADWAGQFSGTLVGTLPLFPSFLDRPFDPSPYAPISRLMWNELYVDPRESPEWAAPKVQKASALSGTNARRLRQGQLVDYRASWELARRVLSEMAAVARSSPGRWAQVLSHASAETHRYALFRAACEATGSGWDRWPAPWRAGKIDLSRIDQTAIDTYIYAQALAQTQISAIGQAAHSRNPLYLDLPVGVHAHGFDTFSRPDLFLHGLSAGAPPDALNAHGQVWGFPPMHPTSGRADGYAHLRAILRRMFSVAGVLRIDHVMGLYRMFCVPSGHDGTHGAYLRYPDDELFAVVLIEAARRGVVVAGEDLGTVPPAVRSILKRDGLLGMHVQQFALHAGPGPSIDPAGPSTLASLNTHDTPTFAGFWHAGDVELRRTLGHTSATSAKVERRERQRVRTAVTQELTASKLPARRARGAALSLMRLQATGPAPITIVNLEDLWGERKPQNVPGTSTQYPNWRRRSAKSLQSIVSDRTIATSLSTLSKDRRRRSAKGRP